MKKLLRTALSLSLACAMTISMASMALAYDADSVSSWAKNEVALADAAQLVTEHTGDNMGGEITRAQFAELIVNYVERTTGRAINPTADTTFSDTTDIAVRKAYSAGIVDGLGNGMFGPDSTATREQIATMFVRASNYMEGITGRNVIARTAAASHAPSSEVADWVKHYTYMMAMNGTLQGSPSYSPGIEMPDNLDKDKMEYINEILNSGYASTTTGSNLGYLVDYDDVESLSPWAIDGMGLLVASGIMKGTSDTHISPAATCTIEQCVVMVYRMSKLV